jgi:hypothetical protein
MVLMVLQTRKCRVFTVLMLLAFTLTSLGCANPRAYRRPNADVGAVTRVAVLPLESHTRDEKAGERIQGIVIAELLRKGIDVMEPGEVTRTLSELKITSIGSLTSTDIQNLGEALRVEAVMTGSVVAYGISKGVSVSYPDVSINLILYDVPSGDIISTVWHTSSGPSFWTRHFGSEGITLSESAGKVVKEAIDVLF